MSRTSEPRIAAPFSASFPIRSLADIRRLEETPLDEALTVRSTYEIFRNAGAAFGRAPFPCRERALHRPRWAAPAMSVAAATRCVARRAVRP